VALFYKDFLNNQLGATTGSPQEPIFWEEEPHGWYTVRTGATPGTKLAHRIAVQQDLGLLVEVLEKDPSLANAKDINGWSPLHEGECHRLLLCGGQSQFHNLTTR